MSRVYVLRHAQAEPGLRDHARELTQYGRMQAQMMGQWLKLNFHNLDLAIVSSSRRTIQTFDGIDLAIESVIEDRAYNSDMSQLIELIRQYGSGHESVLVIGHNPGVTDLVNQAGYPQALAPCSCVVLELENPIDEFNPESANIELWHQARP